MIVWMASLTEGLPYHTIGDDSSTVCGRYIGGTTLHPKFGNLLPVAEAGLQYRSALCRTCAKEKR